MPEGVEIERYRQLAQHAVGRPVANVELPDAWFLKRGASPSAVEAAMVGGSITEARRIGKLLLLDLSSGPVLGLRFGMTGRLLVDGRAGIDELEYGSSRDDPSWDRLLVRFDDGGVMRLNDPRRLGGVELDPDEGRLGPDLFSVGAAHLAKVLAASGAPLKARLMDQEHVAGVGNLIADETLWRAGLDPARPARSLTPTEVKRLHRHLRATAALLLERGGSHLGDLQVARVRGGRCPRDGHELQRREVGGRTTYSCPHHQH